MRVYTFFTDSHRKLFDIFQKNFPYTEAELNAKWFPQESATGNYMADGWASVMTRKVEYILEALKETPENEWFVYSDCDIVLFSGWSDIIKRYPDSVDMMIQNDHPILCAGFFFCKSNVRTKLLWETVLRDLYKFGCDQPTMNYCIQHMPELKVGILPDSYFTYGYFKKGVWNGEDFNVPDISNLKMYHANWAEGVQNKKDLLEKVIRQKNGL